MNYRYYKNLTRLLALLASLLLWGLSFGVRAEVIAIDNAELTRLMAAGIPLIDIRTEPEWRSTGVIPGSRTLTFFDQQGQADTVAWLEKARQIAKPGAPLILVCRSGSRSREASRFLSEQAGYRTVYHLGKGVSGWVGDGRPLSPWP